MKILHKWFIAHVTTVICRSARDSRGKMPYGVVFNFKRRGKRPGEVSYVLILSRFFVSSSIAKCTPQHHFVDVMDVLLLCQKHVK